MVLTICSVLYGPSFYIIKSLKDFRSTPTLGVTRQGLFYNHLFAFLKFCMNRNTNKNNKSSTISFGSIIAGQTKNHTATEYQVKSPEVQIEDTYPMAIALLLTVSSIEERGVSTAPLKANL